MKKLFLLLIVVFAATFLSAQTSIVFNENFEAPSFGDSVTGSTDPVGGSPWGISTTLSNSGLRSDTSNVFAGGSAYLTTNSFSTVGYTKVVLKFAQICKLLIQDGLAIQYSIDGGNNWMLVSSAYYRGSGVMSLDKFNENSYQTLWGPGDTLTKPNASWWKSETFDISALIANQATVKLRFKITDGGIQGGQGRYGFLVDDIRVLVANNEIDDPRITFKNPVLKDTVFVTGPFTVKAYVKDSSALASVNFKYSINGGSIINLPMVNISDSTYIAEIPSQTYNTSVCYSITASDIYGNTAGLPTGNCQSFLVLKGNSNVQVGNTTTSGYNSPIYIPSATSTYLYSYNAMLFKKSEIMSGGTLQSIAFNKADVQGYTQNNATLRIFLKSVTEDYTPGTYPDYVLAKTGAVKVYESINQNLNTTAGWQTFNFNNALINYTGTENLMVFVEWYRPNDATGAVNFYYNSVPGQSGLFYGTSQVPTLSITSGQRANTKFNFQTSTFNYDATITGFDNPSTQITANTSVPVAVRVKNLGLVNLNKAVVKWSVDGQYKGMIPWTGNLPQDFVSSTINLGNINLPFGNHKIKAWTELPNDSIDQGIANDTAFLNLFACEILSGAYTVGTPTSSFPTFADVFTAMNNCGIGGPVTFKIKNGVYNTQLYVPAIANTSDINTITFESESGNKNDVTIQYDATSTGNNFVVKLEGASYIKFKNITIKALNATYGKVVELLGGSSYNTIQGCKIEMATSTSSTMIGINNASGAILDHHNSILNNEIIGGYYAMYIYGSGTAAKETGNVISGNSIRDFYYYGIYTYYQDSIIVKGNRIYNGTNTTSYGMYLYYNDNGIFANNRVELQAATTNYGMYFSTNNNTGGKSLIANNFISQSLGTGTTYGLYLGTCSNIEIFHNSVNVTKGSLTGAYSLYTSGGTLLRIKNNNFVNTGGGYAYYIGTPTAIDSSDNNNIYGTGTSLAYWSGAKADLAALQQASNQDFNSISVNPQYLSLNDLHVLNFYLYGKGQSLSSVTTDIDGDLRANPPCIGADEFIVPQNDAGISMINAPANMITVLNQDVKVTIKNMGIQNLANAEIHCSINGVLQQPYNWTGNLVQNAVDSLIITNFNFSLGINNLKVWTSLPNGYADIFSLNDTLSKVVYACTGPLNGNYTLGGTGATYATFSDAIAALNNCGVSGPTTINVNPGTYYEQFTMGLIPGSSEINTVTFKSLNNDSTSVVLDIPANSTNSTLIKFDATQNVIFKSMTLKSTSASGKVIEITNAAKNIEIANSILQGSTTTTNSSSYIIYSYNTLEEKIKIKNNVLSGGYYGVYLYGISTASKEKNHEISNNIVKDFYYYGLYFNYMDSIKVIGNTINNRNGVSATYALYAYYNDNGIFANNKINLSATSTNYGMYIYYNNSTAGNSRVYNNMVSQINGTGTTYGIAAYYGQNIDYNFNTVHLNAGGTGGYALYAPGGTNITLRNSVLSNIGGGYALYTTGSSVIVTSDYNNFYTTGTNFVYWGSAVADLAALQALSGKDINSVSANPQFVSNTDLHSESSLMFRKGLKISYIPMDIDGQLRDTLKPCIGADEFMVLPNDAKVRALYTLGKLPSVSGSPHIVKALIENKGYNTLYALNVNLSVSGSNTFSTNFLIDSIKSGRVDTISFAGFTPSVLGNNNVKVSLPSDANNNNNELNYLQKVTDTVFAYADTSAATTFLGFNTGQGLFLTKYYLNGSKTIPSVRAYITSSNTLGQKLYGVLLNSNGILVDTSVTKIITAADTNNWVQFNFSNPVITSTANDYFYIGFAQLTGTSGGYYPMGCQSEIPTRRGAFYYTTNLAGGTLIETTQFGRFMIEANTGNPPPFDASLTSIIEPVTGCNMVAKQVKIKITNLGSAAIVNGVNNLIAKYALMINGNFVNIVSEPVNITIPVSGSLNYTFNSTLTLAANTQDSNYVLYSWIELSGDAYEGNDTSKVNIISRFTPQAPAVVSPVSANYATQASLSATSTSPMFWFNNVNDNIVIGQGPSITTPNLFTTDTFFVAANTSIQAQAILGTGTSTNTNTGYPAPYGNYYWGAKHQILVTKAELNSFGITGGPITSLAFDVATVQGTPLVNFEIKVGHTPLTVMSTGAWVANTVPVFSATSYTEVLGWNTHNFNTPFIWNGVDNVVFEVCFNNSSFTYNALTKYTPTTSNSVAWRNSDASDICTSTPSSGVSVNRPNMKIQGNIPGCKSNYSAVVVNITNIPSVDAGVDQITSPSGSISSGINTPVKVIVKNYGTSNLTSASIGWSIDGVVQTSVPWTGTLASGQLSVPFQLANIPFTGGVHTIKAWTFNPNGIIDPYPVNDTVASSFSACMNGNFTIGATGTYQTFNQALNTLNSAGICGNVIFDVMPGTYDEQLTINEIPGVGPNSTVTFRSQNSNNTSVILTYTGSVAASGVLKLNGADYLRFENMTIKTAANNTAVTRAIDISNSASNNIFSGNKIETDISSSSTYVPIYSSSTGKDKNNAFINNRISGGYYGIYWYGSSANMKSNTRFIGNTILDFYYYGMYLYYSDSITVESNTLQNSGVSTASYGMYVYYNNNIQKIVKNKVHLLATTSNYCMYMVSNVNTSIQPALIANNFITQENGTGTVYGIYNSACNNMNFYNNSININSGSGTSTYALYMPSGSGLNVVNNIAVNTAGGYAYYVTTPASVAVSSNNDFYTTGAILAYWGKACANLDSLKVVSGKDANSLSVNPNYTSVSNLHIINFDLDGKAIPYASVTEDIDGEVRSTSTPDIGADEFILPANDAGISMITYPINPVSPGISMIKAVIKNYGTNNLTSAVVNWQVNGISQSPYFWLGNLPTGGVDTAVIGSYNFVQGAISVKSWTKLPNGVADQLNVNDTNLVTLVVCSGPLSGNYTIGGSTANYQTINQAILSLNYCGVSGPVIFNINPGNYNEQLTLTPVTGASALNTITFKSATNDSSSVVVNYAPSSTYNYVLQLNGADYIRFKSITFENTTQNNIGRVVELINTANYNEISNCRIKTVVSTSSTVAGIYSGSTTVCNRNMFKNNLIENGYYGIYWYGSSAQVKFGNTFENNILNGFYYYGIYNYYSDSVTIKGNYLKNSSTSGYSYGVYAYYALNGFKLENNKIDFPYGTYLYPMYINYCSGSSTKRNLIANNFVALTGGTTTYGMYVYYSDYVDVVHNSVNVTTGGTTASRAFYASATTGNTGLRLFNNSFVNTSGGPSMEILAGAVTGNYITAMNYNNLWTNGAVLGKWGATSCSTLSQWVATCTKDSASISVNPDYLTPSDLHVYSIALNDKGTPIANVTTDIDGQVRNTTTPDIGADEYTPLPDDIGVTKIYSPDVFYGAVASAVPVKCIIKNYGSAYATNFNVSYKVGNAIPVNYTYTDTLFANAIDSIEFITPMTVVGGNIVLKAYTSLINDGKASNDTSKIDYFGVPVKGIPYTENFDGTTDDWFQNGGTMQWQKGVPNAGVINTAHSSPNVWTTVLNGNYANSSNDYLYSPIFNNTLFKADTLKFWYKIDAELNKDGGRIEYKNLVGDWITLGTIAPDTNSVNWYNGTTASIWTGTGQGWKQAQYAVSKVLNNLQYLQFRFVFYSDPTNNSFNGWAIDDVELTLLKIPKDAGVTSITFPTASLLGDVVNPKVTIRNFGLDTLTSIPVKYNINGQNTISEVYTGNLVPGSSAVYTFNQSFTVMSQPSYNITAYTTLSGDYYTGSDTAYKTVNVSPALNDVGIESFVTPTDTVPSGSIITVKVRIKNYGSTPVTSVPLSYQRGTQTPVNATWTGAALNLGDTVSYTFIQTLSVGSGSSIILSAFTTMANDGFSFNNKLTKTVYLTQNTGNAGSIYSNSLPFNGDTICFANGATASQTLVYNVPNIPNANSYVWSYSGNNVTISPNDTTSSNTVTLTFATNATSGILKVYGYNTLNNGGYSPDFPITILQNCSVGIYDADMDQFWMGQNMPNPTNGNAIIEYNIPQQGMVEFDIVNMVGQNVYKFNEIKESGNHRININVSELPDGIYYYSLTYKGKRLVNKMLINK